MRRIYCLFIILMFLALSVNPASAANSVLNGSFPDMVDGARPQGMGGAFLSVSDDANAPLWNPAGIAFLKKKQLTTMYADLFNLGLLQYHRISLLKGRPFQGSGGFESNTVFPLVLTGHNRRTAWGAGGSRDKRVLEICSFGSKGVYIWSLNNGMSGTAEIVGALIISQNHYDVWTFRF